MKFTKEDLAEAWRAGEGYISNLEFGHHATDFGTWFRAFEKSKPKVKRKPLVEKEYIFNFEGGGWNTIFAKTKRGAIKAAIAKYDKDDGTNVNPKSFRVTTKKDYEANLRTFY